MSPRYKDHPDYILSGKRNVVSGETHPAAEEVCEVCGEPISDDEPCNNCCDNWVRSALSELNRAILEKKREVF